VAQLEIAPVITCNASPVWNAQDSQVGWILVIVESRMDVKTCSRIGEIEKEGRAGSVDKGVEGSVAGNLGGGWLKSTYGGC